MLVLMPRRSPWHQNSQDLNRMTSHLLSTTHTRKQETVRDSVSEFSSQSSHSWRLL